MNANQRPLLLAVLAGASLICAQTTDGFLHGFFLGLTIVLGVAAAYLGGNQIRTRRNADEHQPRER